MRCAYCGSFIDPYPQNGICPNCGGVLPPDTRPKWQAAPARPVVVQQPVVVQRPVILQPGLHCCSRCGSTAITSKKRGFGWAAGIIGCLFLPPFGLLFGLAGRNTMKYRCTACGHKWERK